MLFLALLLSLVSPSQAGCRTIPDTARISSIGRFSDMQYTEEHAYGRAVDLWRAGNCIFGLLEISEGPAGDTPTGLLTDVRSTATGAFGFIAKLTTGITTVDGSPHGFRHAISSYSRGGSARRHSRGICADRMS
jgi:hypothetical protein